MGMHNKNSAVAQNASGVVIQVLYGLHTRYLDGLLSHLNFDIPLQVRFFHAQYHQPKHLPIGQSTNGTKLPHKFTHSQEVERPTCHNRKVYQ